MDDDNGDDSDENGNDDRPGYASKSTLPLDVVFDLLSEQRRRYAVYYLIDAADDTVDFDALAEQVAAWDASGEPSAELVDRVCVDLYQVHLPKLDEASVIDFDHRSRTVRFWGQPSIEEYAEHAAMQELDDW
jgi:hypothetical protein